MTSSRPLFYSLDLFSGCGGTALGVETAGFHSIGHIEIDETAKKTLELNFGSSPLQSIRDADGDVTKVDLKKMKKELAETGCLSLDLLVASPPCQGFSAAGRAKLNSLNKDSCFSKDPRNKLYKSVVQYISILKPKALLFENVPGMLNVRGMNFVEIFCQDVENLGYNVRCSVLNSAWYGVPQSRERVFVVAFRSDLGITPSFPLKSHNLDNVGGAWGQPIKNGVKWKTDKYYVSQESIGQKKTPEVGVSVSDAFEDLPPFYEHLTIGYRASRMKCEHQDYTSNTPSNKYCAKMRNWPGYSSNVVKDHFCRSTPRDYIIFSKMNYGDMFPQAVAIAQALWQKKKAQFAKGRISQLPKKSTVVPPYRLDCFPEKWQKLDPNKLACTLTAHLEKDGYSHIHFDHKQARTLTIREAARLQSFPDGYQFNGPMGKVFKQIGNAIPPLVATAVAKRIFTDLNSLMNKSKKINNNKPQQNYEQLLNS
nr:hypothetical protein BdHM001_23300 [Bdellovibrio sp. HM001]